MQWWLWLPNVAWVCSSQSQFSYLSLLIFIVGHVEDLSPEATSVDESGKGQLGSKWNYKYVCTCMYASVYMWDMSAAFIFMNPAVSSHFACQYGYTGHYARCVCNLRALCAYFMWSIASSIKCMKASRNIWARLSLKLSESAQYFVNNKQEDLDLDFLAVLGQCESMMSGDVAKLWCLSGNVTWLSCDLPAGGINASLP